MNLQDLVPPLELCKLIPKGEFEDSAFYWFADLMQINKTPPHEYKYTVHEADYKGYNWGGFRCYPAPTLQEILAELKGFEMFGNIRYAISKGDLTIIRRNMVDCALELWLKLKGIEKWK